MAKAAAAHKTRNVPTPATAPTATATAQTEETAGAPAPAEIKLFGRSATTQRIRLLREMDQNIPGFTFVRFIPGRPGVFVVRIGGYEMRLVLSQVEMFAAAFRLSRAHAKRTLSASDVPKIVSHQF